MQALTHNRSEVADFGKFSRREMASEFKFNPTQRGGTCGLGAASSTSRVKQLKRMLREEYVQTTPAIRFIAASSTVLAPIRADISSAPIRGRVQLRGNGRVRTCRQALAESVDADGNEPCGRRSKY